MKTILIVEDIDLNIDLLTQILEDNYRLVIAKNGIEAIEMTQVEQPDLVLMDTSLPIMDGNEAARKIRVENPSLPIIGISANAMQIDVDKARNAGCNDYLTKPVDEDQLILKIAQYLG